MLAPTTAVFLSDDVTHHYATVYDVDYKKQIVTLADPWAQVSFLLTGRNLIGAKAHARLGAAGKSLLELTFKDFARALHGLANAGALLPPTIDVVEKLYPERAGDESFLFWRYSRPLTGGMDATLMTMLELGGRDDLKSKPRLALLSDYTNDLAIGVLSNFANDASAGKDAGRTNFFRRLGNYATGLPWSLKWTLVQRSKLAADYPLQLAIVEGFLKSAPADVDLQIERANLLLKLHRPADALTQSQASRRQWERDVAASIAIKPAEKAIAAFFARNYGRGQDELFAWRYARLTLLDAQAALATDPKAPVASKLTELDDRLGSRVRMRTAFFGEMARIAHLTGNKSVSEALIETTADASLSDRELSHVAGEMFRHFTTELSVGALSPQTQKKLRASPLKAAFCEQSDGGEILTDQQKPLVDALANSAKPNANQTGRPARLSRSSTQTRQQPRLPSPSEMQVSAAQFIAALARSRYLFYFFPIINLTYVSRFPIFSHRRPRHGEDAHNSGLLSCFPDRGSLP